MAESALVDCPKCGSPNTTPVKTWARGSGKAKMTIEHYVCSCGQSFVSWKDLRTGKLKVMAGKGAKG